MRKLILAVILAVVACSAKAGPYYGLTMHDSSATLNVSGDIKIAASTPSYLTPSISLTGNSGTGVFVSSITASSFFGDGSHLTGLPTYGNVYLASTQTFTGLNTFTSSVTMPYWYVDSAGTGIGYGASALGAGHAFGINANGEQSGVAVGELANGYYFGTAVGYYAKADQYGVAVGETANGRDRGVAIGPSSNGKNKGIAIGEYTYADAVGSIAIGGATPPDGARIGTGVTDSIQLGRNMGAAELATSKSLRLWDGFMYVNATSSYTVLAGSLTVASSMTASAFFGDGSHITDVVPNYYYVDASSTAVGSGAYSDIGGTAFGFSANGYNYGTTMGQNSVAHSSGAAVGKLANGSTSGAAIGYLANAYNGGVALGRAANGRDVGLAVGQGANGRSYGISIGYLSNGQTQGIALGHNTQANGKGSIAIGSDANSATHSAQVTDSTFDAIQLGRTMGAAALAENKTFRLWDGFMYVNATSSYTVLGGSLSVAGTIGSIYGVSAATGVFSGAVSASGITAGTGAFTGNAFSVGGSTFVVSGGNVGIGTTVLSKPLTVNGGAVILSTVTIGYNTTTTSPTRAALDIAPANRATATNFHSAPYSPGDAKTWGTVLIRDFAGTSSSNTAVGICMQPGGEYIYNDNLCTGIAAVISNVGYSDSDLAFITRPTGGGATEKMRITQGGLVGIGTTAPAYPLDIASSGGIMQQWRSASTQGFVAVNNGVNVIFGSLNNYPVDFKQNNADAMRIDTSKRVGIGTTGPTEKLEVFNGNIKTNYGVTAATGVFSGAVSASGITASTGTFTGNAFSVGGSTFVVSGGNVGINIANPVNKLVVGTVGSGTLENIIVASGTTTSSYPGIAVSRMGTSRTASFNLYTNSSLYWFMGIPYRGGEATENFVIGPNEQQSSAYFSIAKSGSNTGLVSAAYGLSASSLTVNTSDLVVKSHTVGIGTTAPSEKLEVFNGNIKTNYGISSATATITGVTTGGALCLNASHVLSKCSDQPDSSGNCTCP